jgi:hypothetical protein
LRQSFLNAASTVTDVLRLCIPTYLAERRVILLIAFLFAMSMVLLNLLIALMSDAAAKVRPTPIPTCVGCTILSDQMFGKSYPVHTLQQQQWHYARQSPHRNSDSSVASCCRQASDDDGTKFLCSKAELIDELESSLPSFMRGDDWCTPPAVPYLEPARLLTSCLLVCMRCVSRQAATKAHLQST